jgi:hypothetical protein
MSLMVVNKRPLNGLDALRAAVERLPYPSHDTMATLHAAQMAPGGFVQVRPRPLNGLGMIEGLPAWLLPVLGGTVAGLAVGYFAFKK